MASMVREQRHRIAEELATRNRGAVRWIGFGFVAALAIGFMAYEKSTVPEGIDARHYFERLFSAGGENTAYDASGKAFTRRGLVREGAVECGVHDDGRNDRAYDYDCVATLKDPNGCTRYFPFYVERSSIGPISRPVSEQAAIEILKQFKLFGAPGC